MSGANASAGAGAQGRGGFQQGFQGKKVVCSWIIFITVQNIAFVLSHILENGFSQILTWNLKKVLFVF